MRLQSRIEKLENQIPKPENRRIVWDFSKMSNDQLLKLRDLVKAGNAESYTKELIEKGLLTNPIIERGKREHKK